MKTINYCKKKCRPDKTEKRLYCYISTLPKVHIINQKKTIVKHLTNIFRKISGKFPMLTLSLNTLGSTRICVFISDAPPHALGCGTDGFPNGCPCGLDPMQVAREVAAKGITIYTVGCEPAINPYKEWFMAVAHVTGGQYVPLGQASLLSQVTLFYLHAHYNIYHRRWESNCHHVSHC